MILKRFIINLFLKLKTQLFRLIDEEQIYVLKNSSALTEIIDVLKSTLCKIEDIYYRHILFPKLQEFGITKEMDQTTY
jgi:hypothetical protein